MNIESTDYDIDLFAVLLWQYQDATNLQALINNKSIWLATYGTNFWNDWYLNVFNLATANLFGLTVWSIILNLPLFVPISEPDPSAPVWGFNYYVISPTLDNSNQNFGFGNLAGSLVVPTLTEDEQRTALQLKYYQLISRGAVTEVNQFLNYIFGSSGGAWMIDNLDMTIEYVFNFPINPVLLGVIKGYELLPKPAGVDVSYTVL